MANPIYMQSNKYEGGGGGGVFLFNTVEPLLSIKLGSTPIFGYMKSHHVRVLYTLVLRYSKSQTLHTIQDHKLGFI